MKLLLHCRTLGNKGPDSCLETFLAMTRVGNPHKAQWALGHGAETGRLPD